MRKIAEIRNELTQAAEAARNIDRSDKEACEKAIEKVNELIRELNAANAAEAAAQALAERSFQEKEKAAGRSFSIVKFLRELSEGKGLTGLEKDAAEMGAEEYRRLGLAQQGTVLPACFLRASSGQNYTVPAEGGNLIETAPARYMADLKNRLIVNSLGATVLTDLVGTVPFLSSSSFVGGWGNEGDEAPIEKINFSKITLTPHRNWVVGALSKDLLRQTSVDVENLIKNKLLERHAEMIDAAAFAGTGANGQPTGILKTAGITTIAGAANGAAITWKNIVALETAVNSNNANKGRMAYATNAKVVGELKTVEKITGSGRFLTEDGKTLNGYPMEWSNIVPSNLSKGTGTNLSALIFGNWQDLVVGQWGGLDIVIDPFSAARKAEIIMTLNAWNDVKVVEPKSFAAIVDVIA